MSTSGTLGETIRTFVTHIGSDGLPILGATFSVVVANRPDDSVFPVSFREIGNGVYEVAVLTTVNDVPGEWFLLIQADNGYRYEEVFDVSLHRPSIVEVPSTPQYGATRQQLRRMIAQQLGDLTIATATVDGTESILTDVINLDRETNAFNGMQIYCADAQQADNIGKIGTISSNNPTTRSVNFNPPLPYLIKAGDVFELYNYRDIGWKFDEYNRAINDAILRGGQEHGTLPYTAETVDVYNSKTNSIPIPNEFAYFSGLDIIGKNGSLQKVPYRFYEVDTFSSEVRLVGDYRYKANGRKLRLKGHREPELLYTDYTKTNLPTEWVTSEAAAILYQHDVSMGSGGRERLIQFARAGADGRRSTILATYGPNTVKMKRG